MCGLNPFGQRSSVNGFLVTHCAPHKRTLCFSLLTPSYSFLLIPPTKAHSNTSGAKHPSSRWPHQAFFLELLCSIPCLLIEPLNYNEFIPFLFEEVSPLLSNERTNYSIAACTVQWCITLGRLWVCHVILRHLWHFISKCSELLGLILRAHVKPLSRAPTVAPPPAFIYTGKQTSKQTNNQTKALYLPGTGYVALCLRPPTNIHHRFVALSKCARFHSVHWQGREKKNTVRKSSGFVPINKL